MIRVAKKITDKDLIEQLYNLKEEDVTATFMYETFGEFNGIAKAAPYDLIDIKPGIYGPENKKNKNTFTTTVGVWIFNKWFIESDLFPIFGYMNKNITTGIFKDINQELSYALMEDRITVDILKRYLMKTQIIMPYVTILAPNHSEKILTCTDVINKKKEELLTKNKEAIEHGDVHTIELIEKELLDFAIEYVGDDPSMDTFLSGARGSINNHFKNMYVMKGAIRDPDPNAKQQYKIATSNYMDGIKAEEYALYSNSASAGPYSRGKKTEYGGYLENLFAMAYQDIRLDKSGTDCGSKATTSVLLTKKNVNLYMYNNIVKSDGTLVELNSTNMNKYIGKRVNMRFANLCLHEKPCNACAGNFFYKLNLMNPGLAIMQVASTFKNKAMKAFHDSTISTTRMDVMKAFDLE